MRNPLGEIDGQDIENQSNLPTKTAQAVYHVSIRCSATGLCLSQGLTLMELLTL